jgi:inward rectifier potassium channel
MATVGYGDMFPATLAGNIIATTEIIYGVLTVALSTGILFARLSRPTARVLFSNIALITLHDEVPTLMFRVANQRRNQMVDARVSVVVLRSEKDRSGNVMRRFRDADLVRSSSPALALTWTVMHTIDENSPFYGMTPDDLNERDVHILCNISGIDDNYAQTVYARHVYGVEDLRWNARFADVIERLPDGRVTVDYRKFHDTID